MKTWFKILAAGMCVLGAVCSSPAQVSLTNFFNTTNFFNWETAPVHPVALSPDGTRLAVCNLPDNRLEIFDVTSGLPVSLGNIPVGLDPVAVRFRTGTEIWVANFISDSVSIIDLPTMRVLNTITTSNEPSDVVFAGTPQRAFVSCSQPNLVQVFNPTNVSAVTNLAIIGNRPRAMDVSPDGSKVYVGIFESGNGSTIIGSGVSGGLPRPNVINIPSTPEGGLNPPPNSGTSFVPPINPALSNNPPPQVGLIVKKNAQGRWMDDNQGDWTEYITGTNAAFTGRPVGWDVVDNDLAVINATNFGITYATGLMNICMAVAVNPTSGQVSVVGTEAINNIRFQDVLKGIFIRVRLAQVDSLSLTSSIVDLNPHLTYQVPQIPQDQRELSVGDPRGIIWSADGSHAYVTGLGSDNVIIIDAQGNRLGAIALDQGPTGLALDESRNRLYTYNRFAGSLSVVDTAGQTLLTNQPLFDPTPPLIKAGRPHLYNTHQTSGLGQAACASCHVDSRFDRLAWDLGDQTDVMKGITNANFVGNGPPAVTNIYHPMKGPMTTLTLQDIIGHEPFHWRGDRDGIEEFSATFTNLQGAVTTLTDAQMAELKAFLGTIRFAPNPFRNFDNTLSTSVPLPGQYALGRGVLPAGAPLPNGNAQNGENLFRETATATSGCRRCHTLPTGLGPDMAFNTGLNEWVQVPLGPNSAHHAALVQLDRSLQLPFKVAQLRSVFEKIGMDFTHTNSRSGFGLFHDGSVTAPINVIEDGFGFVADGETADLIAFLMSISGSDLVQGTLNNADEGPGLNSLDTPAAVGKQITISNSASVTLVNSMITLATSASSRVDLVVKGFENGIPRSWYFDRVSGLFLSDRRSESNSPAALRALAAVGSEQTYTMVPRGTGKRIGIDRDADGFYDRDEIDAGSDPANPLSVPNLTARLLSLTAGRTTIGWNSITGMIYQVQYKTNLTDAAWINLTGNLTATGNVASATDLGASVNYTRFYRVLALP